MRKVLTYISVQKLDVESHGMPNIDGGCMPEIYFAEFAIFCGPHSLEPLRVFTDMFWRTT